MAYNIIAPGHPAYIPICDTWMDLMEPRDGDPWPDGAQQMCSWTEFLTSIGIHYTADHIMVIRDDGQFFWACIRYGFPYDH